MKKAGFHLKWVLKYLIKLQNSNNYNIRVPIVELLNSIVVS